MDWDLDFRTVDIPTYDTYNGRMSSIQKLIWLPVTGFKSRLSDTKLQRLLSVFIDLQWTVF